nr:MAG TPA: hypothetical protein [Caudoviricetes sp.]
MAIKVTKKAVINEFGLNRIVCIPYADLQRTLRDVSPVYYTAGVYGWNADIYIIDRYAICTGYRPFGHIELSREEMKRLEEIAKTYSPRAARSQLLHLLEVANER